MLFDGVNERGAVALAFANSACPEAGCRADERTLGGLLACLSECGAIDAATERRLLGAYANTPEGDRAVETILRFRELAVDVLETLRSGEMLSDDTLKAVNEELARCGCAQKLEQNGDGYRTKTAFAIDAPRDVLMPIAHSLAEIITSAPRDRLKQCREPRCSCYFIDTSKNATRAWCSMQRCGNRQKVAKYYRRERERAK
jgi:predicted RNA-binding Zn ribbon-like protein